MMCCSRAFFDLLHGQKLIICRYEVDTREWPETSYLSQKSAKGLGNKIAQWHDLLLPLFLIDPDHRIVGDKALDANANQHH